MLTTNDRPDDDFDVIIVGAGFAGLYALHRLRALGLRAAVLEGGPSVGGTWYWNRYPGARCDAQSLIYCYMFDKNLSRRWRWSERYASQAEILSYLRFVADELDLERDIRFNTWITGAAYDEADRIWRLSTADRRTFRARWLVMATGALSIGRLPDIAGIDSFAGQFHHTSSWPLEGVDFAGKRVGVVGTGSSGVQVIPRIAEQASHVTVFQRTPGFVVPARNREMDNAEVEHFLSDFEDIRHGLRRGDLAGTGDIVAPADFPPSAPTSEGLTSEQCEALLRYRWNIGGVTISRTFGDIMTNSASNALVADFIRARIREAVSDPDLAEKLVPHGYPFGAKRVCVGTDYYETYNRDNVRLVDLSMDPIEAVIPEGIRAGGERIPLDVIVFATGFDAVTGALTAIDVVGRDAVRLRDVWADGPKTYLGIAVAGFPNMFTITGPGSPSALGVVTTSIEQHVDWLHDLLAFALDKGVTSVEALAEAQEAWTETVAEAGTKTLFAKAKSWYMGDNIPGKPRAILVYAGGLGHYRDICDDVASNQYRGFSLVG